MKPRRRGHRRRVHTDPAGDLNITAFMNLMVVLVPFLLTTAVFSRMAVLSIDVPPPAKPGSQNPVPPPKPDEPPFSVAIRLQADAVVIRAGRRDLAPIPRTASGDYDRAAIRAALAPVKAAHPDHQEIDLLSQPDTAYGDLIAAMDAVMVDGDGAPLFPDVGLGDAPKPTGGRVR